MRKIIQIIPDHTAKAHRAGWLAVCDDGSVWRYHQIEKVQPPPVLDPGHTYVMADIEMEWVWEIADEFRDFWKLHQPEVPLRYLAPMPANLGGLPDIPAGGSIINASARIIGAVASDPRP